MTLLKVCQLRISIAGTTWLKSFWFSFFWSILCNRLPHIVVKDFSSLRKHTLWARIHKHKFSCLNLIYFFCIDFHQFRTHHAMSLLQTTNKGYWRNFGCFRVSFDFRAVWNWTTRVFLRGDMFGFEIIKISQHATTFFFKVRWAWK